MRIEQNYSLLQHNTFHLPVMTRWFIEYDNEADLEKILKDEYFQELRSLSIGSGSNLLFVNDFDGVILHSSIKGMEIVNETTQHVFLRVGAGERWDDVVSYAVRKGWGGIENLSLIPGTMGAAAVQNIGAYGVEICDVLESVEAYNQLTFEKHSFSKEACAYDYRYSCFKNEQLDPHIITYVTLRLCKEPTCQIAYGDLNTFLGGVATPTIHDIRQAVIALRQKKLPDTDQYGHAGSYFMNPIISSAHFEQIKQHHPTIPSFPTSGGEVKLSAGWLIEQSGWKGRKEGHVAVAESHALVILNLGDATGDEIALFAERLRQAVNERFGILLMPEVKYIN